MEREAARFVEEMFLRMSLLCRSVRLDKTKRSGDNCESEIEEECVLDDGADAEEDEDDEELGGEMEYLR